MPILEAMSIERLKKLLDERGEKWVGGKLGRGTYMCYWNSSTLGCTVSATGEYFDMVDLCIDCLVSPENAVNATLGPKASGETSDGYHTFDELYHHRAILFSVIVRMFQRKAWKSKKHADGSMYDGMFIVGIETPIGQATYHYDIEPYWDMFDCKEFELAPEWDGHTSNDAIERIATLRPRKAKPNVVVDDDTDYATGRCECGCCGKLIDPWDYYCRHCGAEVIVG